MSVRVGAVLVLGALSGCRERYCGYCFPLFVGPVEELEDHDLVFVGAVESFGEDTRGCDTDLSRGSGSRSRSRALDRVKS